MAGNSASFKAIGRELSSASDYSSFAAAGARVPRWHESGSFRGASIPDFAQYGTSSRHVAFVYPGLVCDFLVVKSWEHVVGQCLTTKATARRPRRPPERKTARSMSRDDAKTRRPASPAIIRKSFAAGYSNLRSERDEIRRLAGGPKCWKYDGDEKCRWAVRKAVSASSRTELRCRACRARKRTIDPQGG